MTCADLLIRLLAWVLLTTPLVSSGEEGAALSFPGVSLKGFGTIGVARSDDDGVQFVRDLTQPDGIGSGWSMKTDSVLGLQLNASFTTQTEAVIQAMSRYRYDGSFTPELSWAFLRHDFSPAFTTRLGRMGTEFYMLSDSRLVGYSNLMARPPPDYYGQLVISYFDGFDVTATTKLESAPWLGLLSGKFYAGYAAERTPFEDNLFWEMKGSLLLGAYVDVLSGPWQVRLSHARLRLKNEQPFDKLMGIDIIGLAPELSVVDKWARFDSLGVVYDNGQLQIQSMLSRINQESHAFEDSRAAYFIAAYRLQQSTPYLGYSWVKSTASRPDPQRPRIISEIMTQLHSDQHTTSLGIRWDFATNLDVKAQVDFIRGAPQSIFPFRGKAGRWDGHMNVFSLTLDFVF